MTFKLLVLVFFVNLVLINANSRYCVSQETCDKCLDQHSTCSWCSDRQFDMRRSRCMSESDLREADCRPEFIQTNKYDPIQIIKNNDLRDFDKKFDSVQIKPQNVKMRLRKSRQQIVRLNYKPARNYPLDLYYLMDLTWSMRDDKQTLVGMGGSLSKSLSNLTENVRLGFGSFADKPIMPYILPGSEQNPCELVHETCLPTYGFKHKLGLTDKIERFVAKVNGSEITGNLDNLEGGLDALMQILVCREEIGWNDKTRKIVLFASDGKMHYAGDGLLAGLVRKNDKTCHLSEDGDYLASLEYDYPSLEEIYRELLKAKISVIFAVTSDVIRHYYDLHSLMQEITSVGELAVDSSNILQLVESGYSEVVKKAQFQDNAPSYIKLDYKTTCGGKHDPMSTNKCDNIEIGNEYDFDVGVTLLSYPEDGTKSLKIKIEEANIDSEGLEIDIEIDYPCTSCMALPGEPMSALCDRQGEWKCGSCSCNKGFVGNQCECNLQDYTSSKDLDNQCRDPKSDTEEDYVPMCSDRGECFCGQCICNTNYDGKYCQCDLCPSYNGMECGGNGICDCGECECEPEFSGKTCECSNLKTNCIAPNTNKVCSGYGECDCNECQCDPLRYGKFCESSPGNETLNSLCVFYEPCVQCVMNQYLERECSNYTEKCSSRDGKLYKTDYAQDISDADIQCIARVRYDDDTVCEYKFTYELDGSTDTNIRIAEAACPPVNVAAYSIIGIIIATFLLGLFFLLLVKFNMYIADKREFAKFEQERKDQTNYIYESPIYKSPVSTFRNPQNDRDSQISTELASKICCNDSHVFHKKCLRCPSSPGPDDVQNAFELK